MVVMPAATATATTSASDVALRRRDVGRHAERDGHERSNGQRGQEAQGANEDEHRRGEWAARPGRPWVDGHAVRAAQRAIAPDRPLVRIGAVPRRYVRSRVVASRAGRRRRRYDGRVPGRSDRLDR